MELQTFTFFLLAFVALTDGVGTPMRGRRGDYAGMSWGRRPWGLKWDLMDDSIDMTKPENAKAADLARARTEEEEEDGEYHSIDPESAEAQNAKKMAMHWFHAKFERYSMVSLKDVQKQHFSNTGGFNYRVKGDLDKKDKEPGEMPAPFPAQFEIFTNGSGEPVISVKIEYYTSPGHEGPLLPAEG